MFSAGSLRIRQIGNDSDSPDNEDRVESIRQMSETLDLLFDVFCQLRFGNSWSSSLKSISNWLSTDQKAGKSRSKKAA